MRKTCTTTASIVVFCSLPVLAAPATTTRTASRSALRFSVVPAATGRQMVRTSLPFPRGWLHDEPALDVAGGVVASVRPLTWHAPKGDEPRSVRRALVSFPYEFTDSKPVEFAITPRAGGAGPLSWSSRCEWDGPRLKLHLDDGQVIEAIVVAPERSESTSPTVEVIEASPDFYWARCTFADAQWPRIVEIRADAIGTFTLVVHVQRNANGDGRAPDLGWAIRLPGAGAVRLQTDAGNTPVNADVVRHEVAGGRGCSLLFDDGRYACTQPSAALRRRGVVEVGRSGDDVTYHYWRCRAAERVPMQQAAWHRAEIVIAPAIAAPLTPTLQCPHAVRVRPDAWEPLHDGGSPVPLGPQSPLRALLAYHHEAVVRSACVGDDWGNVTGYVDGQTAGGVLGMNRLNHCPAMFFEAHRSGDRRLIETAVAWCDNFYDQSIWWGPGNTGGTRYNNVVAMGHAPFENDTSYMWRSNTAVHFCTKGYDSFFLAYEETGDPFMREALAAQVDYAVQHVFANQGECRNIGDVADFVRLYEYTGEAKYLDQALRLFRELRTKLSTGDLFDQGGKPLDADPPFIDDDNAGMKVGYAKPYIIGYALNGLPALARYAPDEPKLKDVIRAVADFLAASEDPVGGWRYPHPASSTVLLGQAMEHAWQIVQADRYLGPQEAHLDAIERVLRQRLHGWLRTGQVFSGLAGWEMVTGRIEDRREMYSLYKRPADRDPGRDYTSGAPSFGGAPPEGLVYFPEVLSFYLQHRPESRLLEPPKKDEPLGQVLERVPNTAAYQRWGVRDSLPIFRDALADRMTHPLSWLSGEYSDFDAWRAAARAKVMERLLAPPPVVPFAPAVIAEQDRGPYVARKVVFNITGDSRVLGLMLAPKGEGPFPAVLLLHDHGAKFDIGKEKVIETWDDPTERPASARAWVAEYYGGRYIGDELAKRGYVCFCTDALNWSDRGGAGYDGQQALASNLLNMGSSLAGCIAYEDLRAAEFLAGQREVDPKRIAAVGLSMGAFRTWQVAALSDHIAAGAAICWMATHKGLMVPGNNQTSGQSAYTTTHPGLAAYLDYPDVASLACPKPMLFYNGRRDGLFPVDSVEEAYAKMHAVWTARDADEKLETRLWDVPHVFNRAMQDEAFAWLDRQFGRTGAK